MCYMRDRRAVTRYPARAGHGSATDVARVGVRELRQNLSVYLRRVEAGETLEVTEHGRPVARLTPLPARQLGVLERLVAEGRAVPGTAGILADLGPTPDIGPGPRMSDILERMRNEDDR
jgi:prevent-host-death family protein